METERITATIAKLFHRSGLGSVIPPVSPVAGGFLHSMYRVETRDGIFAVKHLNPAIMMRPGALNNYRRAETYEQVLEDAGIPIVPALPVNGKKMQHIDGAYFYLFRWQNGEICDYGSITAEQCRIAGNIQGRIHAVASKRVPKATPERSSVDWSGLMNEASAKDREIGMLLKENEALLLAAENEWNAAREALPGIECIVDEDMDPKNVMWDEGRPHVIDLECLERGNPVSSVLQLSLDWAGCTVCSLDTEKLDAFMNGYLEAYDNGFREYGSVFGMAFAWIEWLEFNVKRALGAYACEAERGMAASEVRKTAARIRYLYETKDRIIQFFDKRFRAD